MKILVRFFVCDIIELLFFVSLLKENAATYLVQAYLSS